MVRIVNHALLTLYRTVLVKGRLRAVLPDQRRMAGLFLHTAKILGRSPSSQILYPFQTFHPLGGPALQIVRTVALLRPNNMKYRKAQKNLRAVLPRYPTTPVCPPKLCYGAYGVYSMESLRITSAQIEAVRMAILRGIGKRGFKIWIRIFPHIPVTKKALGVRMGKGKGAVDHFVAHLRAGKMVCEFDCPTETLAKKVFQQVNHKLPVKTKFVIRDSPHYHHSD